MDIVDPQARRRAIDDLKEQGRSLQSSVAELQEQLTAAFPETAVQAVRLDFDEDNVLSGVHIDEAVWRSLNEQQLGDQFRTAFALAPLPRFAARRLMESPTDMQALRDRAHPPETVEFRSSDRTLTLVAQLGRPIEIRYRTGALLMVGPTDLGDEIVALARQAATSERERKHV